MEQTKKEIVMKEIEALGEQYNEARSNADLCDPEMNMAVVYNVNAQKLRQRLLGIEDGLAYAGVDIHIHWEERPGHGSSRFFGGVSIL